MSATWRSGRRRAASCCRWPEVRSRPWRSGCRSSGKAIFIGTILTATSVSISAQTLIELGVLRSREGTTILGAAVIDDVMGIIVLSVVVGVGPADGRLDPATSPCVVARMACFFALAVLGGTVLRAPIAGWARRLGVSQGLLAIVVVIAFIYAWAAEFVGGVAAITGAYLAGVLFTRTSFKKPDRRRHPPADLLGARARVLRRASGCRPTAGTGRPASASRSPLLAVADRRQGGRLRALAARLFGFATEEAVRVGVGMISRGEVGLIVASYGLTHGSSARRVLGIGHHGPGHDDGDAAPAPPDVPPRAAAAEAGRRGDRGRSAGGNSLAGFRTESARPGRPARRCCR